MADDAGPVADDAAATGAGTWRRLRLALAACAALGLGTTAVSAAWIDAETAGAEFRSGLFVVEASASSPAGAGDWSLAAAPDGLALSFAGASGLLPGSAVYAPLTLRTRAGSASGTVAISGATVTSTGSGVADLGPALRYRAVLASECGAAAFGTGAQFVVGGPSLSQPLTTGMNDGASVPLAAAPAAAPGAAQGLCFEVTLPAGSPGDLQGKAAQAVWTLTAVSS